MAEESVFYPPIGREALGCLCQFNARKWTAVLFILHLVSAYSQRGHRIWAVRDVCNEVTESII